MALNKSIVSGLGVSLGIHVVVLLSLSFIVYDIGGEQLQMVVDSVFAEERAQEEFSQEIEQDNEVADSMNVIAGGAITSAIGGSGAPAVAQTKIEQAESLKEPEIKVNVGAITAPGLNTLGNDLGAGEVTGDIGQVVEGYGAAMSQFTQELVRLMRDQRVLVVWAFDESESMKPAQKEVREKFGKIYEELGIAAKQDQKLKASDEVLLTVVTSYGQGLKEQTAKPTANISEIRAAIDKIDID
ncbi:MAG TPA: VWA domain-containing protein, partial [Planctomycetaceae bacterium]|nr:VWA domain-containing protein [Planctomycetaceae bacterium]